MRTNRRVYPIPSLNSFGIFAAALVGWLLMLLPAAGLCATVTLTWDANSEADLAGYRVHYGTGSCNYSNVLDVGDTNTAAISNLTAGQKYYFAVTAYDTEGLESEYSKEVAYEPPVAVTTYAIVTLTWDANSEADLAGYRVHYGTGSCNYSNVLDVGDTNTAAISNLTAGQKYYFAVTAYDTEGLESGYSKEVAFEPPVAVTAYTIIGSAGAGGSISPSGSVTVNGGGSRSFTITPADGYQIADVVVDGSSVGAVSSYTISKPTGDHTITASFTTTAGFKPEPRTRDRDEDGMMDGWERRYGLNPKANDADDDPDHDGITNLNEYLGGTDPAQPDANVGPGAPELTSPTDSDLVTLEPSLEVGEFYDPDTDDTHGETEWQIFRQSDGKCVFELRSRSALTSVTVPAMVLDAQTDYTWQVRFYDNHGQASEWSIPGYFTSQQNGADSDDNGIPDDQQVDVSIDIDGNGTYDSDQANIKSVRVKGKTTLIGLGASDSSEVVNISALRSENPDDQELFPDMTGKPGATPFGLINFKVRVGKPGDAAELTVRFSESVPQAGVWYKYDSINKRWDDFSEYAMLSPNRKSLILYLEDGGVGDADGVANGIIVDPSGLVVVEGNAAPDGGGGGGAAGCFVGASTSTRRDSHQSSDSLEPISRTAICLIIFVLIGRLVFVLNRRKTKFASSELHDRDLNYALAHQSGFGIHEAHQSQERNIIN